MRISATNGANATEEKDVVVVVSGVNDAPVAASVSASVAEDGSVIINLTDGATDVDGNPLSIASVSASSSGVVSTVSSTQVSFTASGMDYLSEGTPEVVTFNYQLTDGTDVSNIETVSVTVTGINDVPTGELFSNPLTVGQGGTLVLDPLNGMSDADGLMSIASVNQSTVTTGSVVYNAGTDTYSYVADPRFDNLKSGDSYTDYFSFVIQDDAGASVTRYFQMEIQGEDDARTFDFEDPDLGATGTSSEIPSTPYDFDNFIFANVGILDTDAFSGPEQNASASPTQAAYVFSGGNIYEENGFEFDLESMYVTGVHEEMVAGSDGLVRSTGDVGATYTFTGYRDGTLVGTLDYASTVGVQEQLVFGSDFDDIDNLQVSRDSGADAGFVLAFDDVFIFA